MTVVERDGSQMPIELEASQWLARLRLTPDGAEQAAAFQAWRDADVRNAAAFDRLSQTLEDVASLKQLGDLEPIHSPPLQPANANGMSGRRQWAIAAVAVLAVSAPIAFHFTARPPEVSSSHATKIAEMRVVPLPDGSRVTLAPKSRLRFEFNGKARRVQLVDGEAYFEIVHDASRPFEVHAGHAVIRDLGTKFDVNHTSDSLRVAVLEGSVEVDARTEGTTRSVTRVLRQGQGIELAPARAQPAREAAAQSATVENSASPAGDWREGRLTYDNVRLADVVADLNRYYSPGVRLANRSLGERRIAASFKTSEINTFLSDLPSALSVDVDRDSGGAILIRPSKQAAK